MIPEDPDEDEVKELLLRMEVHHTNGVMSTVGEVAHGWVKWVDRAEATSFRIETVYPKWRVVPLILHYNPEHRGLLF